MKSRCVVLLASLLLALSLSAGAESRPDHFEGKPAANLTEAVANFSAYNAKLAALLEQPALTPADLHEVHQLTYTLENALQKINQQLTELADVLEEVHLASETVDAETVQQRGAVYLQTATAVVP